MSTKTLTSEDERDFHARLANYELLPDDAQASLDVPSRRVLQLSRRGNRGTAKAPKMQPKLVKVHDLNSLEKMFGLPDGIPVAPTDREQGQDDIDQWKPAHPTLASVAAGRAKSLKPDEIDFGTLDATDLAMLHTVARGYGGGQPGRRSSSQSSRRTCGKSISRSPSGRC